MERLPAVKPGRPKQTGSYRQRFFAALDALDVLEYLEVGVPLVWVVYPRRHQVVIYRVNEEETMSLHEKDVIENLPELPGFRCFVSEFFV